MVRVTIDERPLEVEAGSTVLQAAERLGIDIPTFCYLKRLPPLASCRMCLVEIEGQRRLQPSCATAVTDGMVVRTNTPLVDETRSSMLDMLLANHPLDCPICDKGGECELQDQVMAYGPRESGFRDAKRVFHSEDIRLSPVVIMNVNRCIQCQRCVRMCADVVGAVALGTVEKGMDTAVTGFEGSLASCDQCGNCIEVCPVGALMSFPYRYKARPWDLAETDTICPHCGTGCQLTVGTRKGEFMRVRSKWEHGVNRETLCVRGRFGLDFVGSPDRIKRPLIRRDGALVAVSWNEAGDELRRRLSAVENKAAGGLASPRLPNEVLYQFQRLMRTVFRTNNIDCTSRWPTPFDALGPLMGFYTRAPLEEVLGKDCVLVVGGNVTEENPVTEYLLRDGARQRHTRLLMLSARPSRLDADARAVVRTPPGGEALSLAAVVAGLMTAAGATLPDVPVGIGATTAVPITTADGGPPDRLIATLLEGRSVTVLVSVDILRSPEARATLQQLTNLLRLLRILGKDPAMQFLFDRANQLGAWDMGVLPAALPGLHTVADDVARAALERVWGAAIPSDPGADFDAMLELCNDGRMGALYIVGSDPLMAYPDRTFVKRALAAVDLLIVQDTFLTDTVGLADIVLPAAGYGEESGTFTNNEGRTQKVCKFREAAFEARGNLEIFDFIAALRNQELQPSTQGEIFDEITKVVPAYQGLTQNGLGVDGAFTRAAPTPPAGEVFAPPPAAPNAADGLMLITGNCLFHNGYLSERSQILNTVADDPYVEMSARDAAQLGFSDRDQVVVRSAQGELTAQLKINKHFPGGLVFVPENYRNLRLNSLMRRGEYPCPVEVHKAHAAVGSTIAAGVGARAADISRGTAESPGSLA